MTCSASHSSWRAEWRPTASHTGIYIKRLQVCLCLSEHTAVSSHSTVTPAATVWFLLEDDEAGNMQQMACDAPFSLPTSGPSFRIRTQTTFCFSIPSHPPSPELRAREGGDQSPAIFPCLPSWHLRQVTPLPGPQFPHRAWH